MIGQSVLHVEGVMVGSTETQKEHVPAVARWATLLGTVLDGRRTVDRVREVIPGAVITVERRDIYAGIVPRCKLRLKDVGRQASQARVEARPQHRGCMNCPRTQPRLDRS